MKKMKHIDLMHRVRDAETAKTSRMLEWQRNIAFRKGRQWIIPASNRRGWQTAPLPRWKVSLTINYMLPISQIISAKLVQNRPSWEVRPWTNDERDRMAARGSEMLLEHMWEYLNMHRHAIRFIDWAYHCGTVGVGVYWNHTEGFSDTVLDPDGNPIIDEKTGLPLETMYGRPEIDVVSPFDLGIDPYAEEIENIGWMYRTRWVHKSWIKDYLDKRAQDGETGDGGTVEHRTATLASTETGNDPSDWMTVWEMYSKLDKRYWIFSKERILDTGKYEGDYPIILFRMVDNPGDITGNTVAGNAIWGQPMASSLVPIQMELNKAASQIIEYKNQTISPRFLASKMARMDVSSISERPNSLVMWSGQGQEPKPLYPRGLPGFIANMPDTLKQQMLDVAGVHEISHGQAPGSVQSGRGLAILAEMDQTKWGPATVELDRVFAQIGTFIMKLWRDHAPPQLTVRVVGKNNEIDVREIYRSDVMAENIRVAQGSTFAKSKALRHDQITQAWQLGLIEDRGKVLKALDFGDVESIYGDNTKQRLRARRENGQLLEGILPQIQEWDDDLIHMDEIEEIATSEMWDSFPEEVQQVITQHYSAHKQRYQALMQMQMQAAAQRGVASAGGGGGGPVGMEGASPEANGETPGLNGNMPDTTTEAMR
jgi:hypothetical protein